MTGHTSRPVAPWRLLPNKEGNGALGLETATPCDTGARVGPWSRLSTLHAQLAEAYAELAAESGRIHVDGIVDSMAMNGDMAARGRRLLTARDVADVLGVDVRTVRRWREAGKLPAPLTLGDSVLRWHPEDVDAWLEELRG